MRVISGTARGTRLAALPGEEITRPTVDRVKEGMFSAVQFLLAGARVLDLFAGSGQLGIEAVTAPGGTVLAETEHGASLPERCGTLTLKKQYKYGTVALARYEADAEF